MLSYPKDVPIEVHPCPACKARGRMTSLEYLFDSWGWTKPPEGWQ
jgi:hypothetical protein